MADRSVKVRLQADASGLVAGFRTASKAVQDFSRNADGYVQNHKDSINDLSNAALGLGAGLTALSLGAIKTAADFDESMSSVAAATMAPKGELAQLRQAALDAGQATKYSATESAGAIEELAKAGVSTQEILGGGLKGALDLAASGNIQVGEAAESAASAMTQFGLSGKDVPHIADLLAAGAGKAQGEVGDLGQALNQSGVVASQFGLSIEETVGGLSAFAAAGTTGSDAGTSFKTMLQRLSNPSKEAANELENLGIQTYDAQGNFVGLSDFAGQLQDKMKDLSPEARNAAMSIIFGSDAVRAANVLYSEGQSGIQGWIDNVNDSGFAAEQARIRMDNLKGDIEQLGGALETAFIGAGDGAQSPLRGVVQMVTDIVNAFGALPPVVQQGLGIGSGIVGVSLLAAGGLGKLIIKVSELRGSMKDLGITTEFVRGKMGLLGKATVVGLAVSALVAAIGDYAVQAGKAKQNTEALVDTFDDLTGAATAETNTMIIDQLNEQISVADWSKLKEMGYTYTEFVEAVKSGGKEFDDLQLRLAQDENSGKITGDEYVAAANALQKAKDAYGESSAAAKQNAEAQKEVNGAAVEGAASQEALQAAVGETGVQLDGVIEDMEKFLELLFATGLATMSARDAEAAYHESIRDVGDTVTELNEKYGGLSSALNENRTDFDLTTEAGQKANGAFQDIARDGMSLVEAKAKEGVGQPELQQSLKQTYDDLINAAHAMGIEGDAADELARSVLGIPEGVSIDTWMSDAAAEQAQVTQDKVNGIDRDIRITTRFITIGSQPAVATGDITRSVYGVAANADGNVYPSVRAYADGGESHVAQIAPAGAWRLWAEPETGGEAYIPLAASKRGRSTSILADVAGRFGYGLEKYADGGLRPMEYERRQVVAAAPVASGGGYSPTFNISGPDASQVVAIADGKAAHYMAGISSWRR